MAAAAASDGGAKSSAASTVAFGYGVSLRILPEISSAAFSVSAYLSSPGQADPRLMARRFDASSPIPILQFDRCVFTLEPAGPPPSQLRGMQLSSAGPTTERKRRSEAGTSPATSTSPFNPTAVLEQVTAALRHESEGQPVTYGRSVCLVHVYSGLYLSIVRKPAENPNHFRLALMSKADAGATCRFKLMSRYKIRSDGDPVMDKDMILLEHESGSLGVFASIPSGAHDEAEGTACSSPVSLEISLYDEPSQQGSAAAEERQYILRGGAAALLFHREKDALLVVDGSSRDNSKPLLSTSMNEKDAASEDPSPERRRSLSRIRSSGRNSIAAASVEVASHKNTALFRHFSQPVTSLSPEHLDFGSSAMWFFEHADTRSGAPIACRQPIRLRHGSTSRYLCVVKSKWNADATGHEIVAMPLDTADAAEASILELEVVSNYNRGRFLISAKTFVRLRHPNTGLYLSSRVTGPLVSSLSLSAQPMLDDTLAFILVSQVRQEELSFLIGNAEFLNNYTRVFYQMQERFCTLTVDSPWVRQVVARTISSLESLIKFCTESEDSDVLTREGIPIPSHQESMFEMDLHHTIIEVMVSPFVSSTKINKTETMPLEGGVLDFKRIAEYQNIFRVNRLCYRLLKQMCKGSKYSYKLLEYVDFMQQQEGYKLHISDTLAEILTDNVSLSPEQSAKDIKHNVNLLLTKDRSAGYINFLKLLCVVGETGVVQNQRLVSQLVLEQHKGEVLLRVALTPDGVLMVLVPGNRKTSTDPKWLPLADFLRFSDEKNKLGKFFEASMDLLGALCVGADERVLKLVADEVPMRILTALLQPTFPASDSLRSSFIKLGHHLYVRRFLHKRGVASGDVYSCGELVLKPPTGPLLTPKEEEVKRMLEKHGDSYALNDDENGHEGEEDGDFRNLRTQSSLADDEDTQHERGFLKSIKKCSLEFLDRNTRMSSNEGQSRLILSISNLWHSIVVYHEYSTKELEMVVKAVIQALNPEQDEPIPNRRLVTEKSIVCIQTKQGLLRFLSAVMSHELRNIADNTLHKCVVDGPSQAVSKAQASIAFMCDELFQSKILFRVLLDLMGYEDTELVKLSVELVLSLCNSYGYVAERVCAAETISDPDSVLFFMRFRTVRRSLQKNLSSSGNVLNEGAVVDAIKMLLSPVEHASPSRFLRSELDDQRNANAPSSPDQKSVDAASPSKLRLAVRSMVSAKILNKEAAAKRKSWRVEPTPEVRTYCNLLHRAGIEEMLQKSLTLMVPDTPLCFTVLDFYRILTTSNEAAVTLATRLDMFIPFLDHDSTKLDAAVIILSLVKRNAKLAVSLTSDTVVKLVSLLHRDEGGIISQGLENVVLGEFPIAENQKTVLLSIISTSIVDANRSWSSAKLTVNSATVNLMACCCVNNSTCRGMVASKVVDREVLKVLLSDILPPIHAYPYLKLFTAAFLAFEDEWTAQEITSQKREWSHNADWWDLVRNMLSNLPVLGNFAKSAGASTSFSKKFSSRTKIGALSSSPIKDENPLQTSPVASETAKDTEADNVCMPYVFEGVVPCIATFLQNLYSPSGSEGSLVAIPMRTLIMELVPFLGWVAEYGSGMPVEYTLGAYNLASALAPYVGSTTVDDIFSSHLALFTESLQRRVSPDAHDAEVDVNKESRTVLQGAEDFMRHLPGVNTKEALMPFIDLINANQPLHAIATTASASGARETHEKLVQRMRSWDFDEPTLVSLMAAFRHALKADEAHIVAAQSYLNDIDVLRMVTDVVSSRSKVISSEAYQLGVAILEGGNKGVQDSLLNYLGTNDEKFFQDVEDVISVAIRQGRERRTRAANATFYHVSTERLAMDFGHIHIIFRFLQLLCEGHHLGLQEYLREQHDNLKSVNIVKAVSLFFSELLSSPSILESESSINLLLQTLALLTEMCQGPCRGNQEIVVNHGVCSVLNTFLTAPQYEVDLVQLEAGDESAAARLEVQQNAVTLLLALLEGFVDGLIPLTVVKEVPLSGIDVVLGEYINNNLFKDQKSEALAELVYGIIVMVNTCVNSITAKVNEERDVGKAIIEKYSKHIGLLGIIEIEREKRIERVYFRVPQMSQSLSEESKDSLLWSVDRSNQSSKLSDFLDKADEIIFDIEASHNATAKLRENRFFKSMARFQLPFWDDFTLGLAILINLLFVMVMADAKNLMDNTLDLLGVEGILLCLALLQVFGTFVSMLLDGFLNYPLVIYKTRKELKEEPTVWQKVRAIMMRRETAFRVLNLAVALAGLSISDFFFAIHLLGIISRISILKNVVVAVTLNGKSLLLTGLLGCIFVYLFSIVAFIAFQDHFEDASCSSLAGCALHILTTGLRQGGGIGDQMTPIKQGESGYYSRVIYDFLFWAIMIVIFLNILFGIIIDTFAELRDERKGKEEDMRTLCFICGINSFTFDKNGIPFGQHVKEEHNMWQYLYFIHHLQQKEPTEYTGQESYVAECLARRDISFFPSGKCCSLSQVNFQPEEDKVSDADSKAITAAVSEALNSHFVGSNGTDRSAPNQTLQEQPLTQDDSSPQFQGSLLMSSVTGVPGMDGMVILTKLLSKIEALEQAQATMRSNNKLDAVLAKYRLGHSPTNNGGNSLDHEAAAELHSSLTKAIHEAEESQEALFTYKREVTQFTRDIFARYSNFVHEAFHLQNTILAKKQQLFSTSVLRHTGDLRDLLRATSEENSRLSAEVEGLHTTLQVAKLRGKSQERRRGDSDGEKGGGGVSFLPRDEGGSTSHKINRATNIS